MLGKVTLVTGGARSGKSRYALELASEAQNPVFVATASVMDKEMELRVAKHQEERLGRFVTLEEQTDLAGVFSRLPSGTGVVLVDCLTLWLNNLLYYNGEQPEYPEVTALLRLLESPPCPVILVSNELGLGIVPENPLARFFRDLSGWVNQAVAARAELAVLMVSGLPLALKGRLPG
ncbi:MAG: adenosylcobinamide kinase/adenosylcobinamide phosphate guanyltransferase [Candidatus Lambdaproteobacteria bacterium RIFOXYD1_FULL_56_27]|uniref:Bifunctional adenosylcobalamin biosynthesis protein n=1 Tax=Candidatus Lambdaproteobacteria bacterium RIFOXYD2_FULL_56_26 TaxID=1817773 RepID=A0A1F6H3P2_9PROT|nr:MAG: adenosylcobinamide kinase/adenosylcobinamide phosphate guanyltransferase [Candidatus Lambdaproteobacteria bacterium RIFOXYC1_FULL_56_13]OGH04992.1 MAG: adenosylcobinamide kinase/adenosylcobinamide phosphate guanyltransferase [Candidatus Lambdaproteobacteria bacterium RIFOXYD2_FULL_56_26]OGH09457.1 MAG: adenosylcobinamide kinase/adenosylcobinamide phosphate guanyltransferase [Candidatus Lambdaproteobacteria bacterium RIFOXYD1_FULL_56_27]